MKILVLNFGSSTVKSQLIDTSAEMIASNAPIAVAGSKAVALYWRHLNIEEQQKYQNWVNRWVSSSEDSKEGPKAFAEKRTPNWQNR